ncbi:MAG: hypothetical protein ACOZQL_05005 [Myxococcota bacterium]
MGRLITFIMAIAIVGYLGYRSMYGRRNTEDATPKQRLENVKGAAHRIEDDQTKRLDETMQKTAE